MKIRKLLLAAVAVLIGAGSLAACSADSPVVPDTAESCGIIGSGMGKACS